MKKLLLLLVALLGLPAAAQSIPLFSLYDLDATTYVYPILCRPGIVTPTANVCATESPRFEAAKPITTTGASSTTVTAVASNNAFNELLAGDEIEILQPALSTSGARARRLITARASANSVTVDTAIQIDITGSSFVNGSLFAWYKFYANAGAEDGWFSVGDADHFQVAIGFIQAVTTGGIDYKLECRQRYLDRTGPVVLVQGANVTVFPATVAINVNDTRYAECRVGLKITTDDTPGADAGVNQEQITAWLEKGHTK